MYGMEHGGWMLGGGFMMLLWWIVPIGLVALLAAYWLKSGRRSDSEQGPVEILKQRYARGEIGLVEFEQAKRTLGS